MAAVLVQKVKRVLPVELTLYLPTPDKRFVSPAVSSTTSLGNRIKHHRLQNHLSLRELANRSEVSKTYLINLEKDRFRAPDPLFVKRIAAGLELNPMELLSFSGTNNTKTDYIDYIIPPDSLSARIKNFRLRQGITQKELVKRTKLSKDCVWRYEKNITTPSKKILIRIAKALQIDMAKLTGDISKEA